MSEHDRDPFLGALAFLGIVPEKQEAIDVFGVMIEAFCVYLERTKKYNDAWKTDTPAEIGRNIGAKGKRLDIIAGTPSYEEDDALDLINYCCFLILQGRSRLGVPPVGSTVLKFQYKNWKGVEHEYVVDFARGWKPGWAISKRDSDSHPCEPHLVMSGEVIERDGDSRPEMGDNRRRTFIASEMRNIEVVG
jgi:hypothetical protein